MSIDVSVVVPTFRRPATLAETLRSVLGQAGANLEVMVVDDCPDASARKTVHEMADPRVRYLHNPAFSNGRPALLRNMGWAAASREFIHFVDDDDIVPEGHYANVAHMFDRHPEVGVIFGRVEAFGADEGQVSADASLFASAARRASATQRFGSRRVFAARMLFQPLMFVGGAAVVRRRCVEAVHGFDPALELMEDVDLYVRIIRRFGARFLDRVALRYRVGPSLMHRSDVWPIVDRSYVRMQRNYREAHGFLEFYALKIAARTVLRPR